MPSGPERLVSLAFKVLHVSTVVADMAAEAARKLGRQVTCKKGCGICCRQLVPLSPPEAAMIYEFVDSMAEPRKGDTQEAFRQALSRAGETGLLRKLQLIEDPSATEKEFQAAAAAYFREQIPCPFLADECCSIYEVRPSMCREYLVTSPAGNCRSPLEKTIARIPVSLRLSEALARTWADLCKKPVRVVPLVLALEWTEKNQGDRFAAADSVKLLKALLGHVADVATSRSKKRLDGDRRPAAKKASPRAMTGR